MTGTHVTTPDLSKERALRADGHTWLLPRNTSFEPILGDFATIRLLIARRGVIGVQMEAVHGVAHWAAPIR